MGFMDLFKRRPEHRAMTLRDPDGWLELAGSRTRAGVVVSPNSALGHPAVLGAVRLLAELTASLPIIVYERTRDGRRRAEEHPVYRLLHDEPNPIQTPFVFKETLALHLLTHGRAVAQIVRADGRPVALWPIHPTRVSLDTTGGVFTYKVATPEGLRTFSPAEIVDVVMLADDGLNGRSPLFLAREAIGAALAAEEMAADYFANSAQPSGVLEHPGKLSPEAAERLKRSWQAAYGGRGRQGTAVLEEGMKFSPISSTAKDAQLLEARQHSMRAIAAALRIPAHLLDPTARGTYANVETQSLEFLTFSLQPMLTRIEEALNRKLFAPGEPYYAEFLTDELLRADTQSRYAAYETAIRAGWMDPDEVRARENLPPRPRQPAIPAFERHNRAVIEVRARSPHDELQAQLEQSLEAAYRQVLTREGEEILALVESFVGKRADLEQLVVAIRDYYEKATWMAEQLLKPFSEATRAGAKLGYLQALEATRLGILPPMKQTVTEEAVERARERVARQLLSEALKEHIGVSETQILAAVRTAASDPELLEAVERVVADWANVRPGKAAQLHATIIRNEAALQVYREAGATKLRWRTNAGGCAYCQRLDGKVVGVGEPFVAIGEPLAGPGGREDRPMVARYPRVRPPVHLGCKCSIEIAG